MLGLPFIDEQPPGESIELDEELLGGRSSSGCWKSTTMMLSVTAKPCA